MITSCDCDSIWRRDYFLYSNYLCLKNFSSNHVLSNWMFIGRSICTHGHFRRFGSTRCFTSEYHILLHLLKRIDYWDCDLVHENVHMHNKLAILDEDFLLFQNIFLPCDNSIPTNVNSIFSTFALLWNKSLRWNIFTYDLK